MYNEFRRQQLTEAELRSVVRNMIIEEIQSGELNEWWGSNMWNAAKNTFGGDVRKAAGAVQDAGRAVGRAVGDAYGAAKEYGRNRMNSMKAQYNAGQNIDKINKLIDNINGLMQSGVLNGNATQQAANRFIGVLKQAAGRNGSTQSAWRNQMAQ